MHSAINELVHQRRKSKSPLQDTQMKVPQSPKVANGQSPVKIEAAPLVETKVFGQNGMIQQNGLVHQNVGALQNGGHHPLQNNFVNQNGVLQQNMMVQQNGVIQPNGVIQNGIQQNGVQNKFPQHNWQHQNLQQQPVHNLYSNQYQQPVVQRQRFNIGQKSGISKASPRNTMQHAAHVAKKEQQYHQNNISPKTNPMMQHTVYVAHHDNTVQHQTNNNSPTRSQMVNSQMPELQSSPVHLNTPPLRHSNAKEL
jgi:hypothetical protein